MEQKYQVIFRIKLQNVFLTTLQVTQCSYGKFFQNDNGTGQK